MGHLLLLIYLLLEYTRPFELIPELTGLRVMLVLGVIACLASIPALIRNTRQIAKTPQTWLMLAFTAMISLSRIMHGWLTGGLLAIGQFSVSFILFFLILINIDSRKRLTTFIGLWLFATAVMLAQAMAGYHLGYLGDTFAMTQRLNDPNPAVTDGDAIFAEDDNGSMTLRRGLKRMRGVGFMNDPNDFAQALLVMIPFLGVVRRDRRPYWNAVFVVLPLVAVLYGLYLTQSRGGFLALMVLLFFVAANRWGTLVSCICAGIPALTMIALKLGGGRSYGLSDESVVGRLDAWSAGLAMLKASPVWGRGFSQFTEEHELTAHNSFVLCFAELGLLGYFLWMSLLVLTVMGLAAVIKADGNDAEQARLRNQASALRLSLFGFLAAACFLSRTYIPTLYILIALSAAVCRIANQSSEAVVESPRLSVWFPRTVALTALSIAIVYAIVKMRFAA